MFQKRGQGVQFNWIFVLIAGVILLVFFLAFGSRFVDLMNKKEATKIEMSISTIVDSVKAQEQYTTFTIEKDFDVKYDCEYLSIGEATGIPMKDILFMRDGRVKNTVFWSQSFDNPYQIANLVYFVDADKGYYIADSDLRSLIPEDYIKLVSKSNADVVSGVGGDVEIRENSVVYPGEQPISLEGINSDAVKLGAIFSSYDVFLCSVEKLKERQEIIDRIYLSKIDFLGGCDYSGLRNAILSRDVENIEQINRNLDNLGCGVVF